MGLRWADFDLPDKKPPKRKRTFAIDQEIGPVFVAAAVPGDAEHFVYICASDDRQPVDFFNEHYYVPSEWMKADFLNTSAICGVISTVALHYLHGQGQLGKCT